MKRFIEGAACSRSMLLVPEHVDYCIAEDSPVRAVDVFVNELDLQKLGICEYESRRHHVRSKPATPKS
jgi:hypothetical protein